MSKTELVLIQNVAVVFCAVVLILHQYYWTGIILACAGWTSIEDTDA